MARVARVARMTTITMPDVRWFKCTFGLLALQQFAQASVIGIPLVSLGQDCFGKSCHRINEYCSPIIEGCMPCSDLCNNGVQTQNDKADDMCAKECPEYADFQMVTNQLKLIEVQQMVLLVLMILLLLLIGIHYSWKCFRWCRHKRCIIQMLHKLKSKRDASIMANGKDLGGTTIQNMGAIHDNDRTVSQIYSVTGAEGSVMTMTTPISTRHPAEDTTLTTVSSNEYSYENQALEVTSVSEKPNGSAVF